MTSADAESPPQTSPLDPKVLGELRTLEAAGAQGLVQRVAEAFLQSSPSLAQAIDAASAASNPEALRQAAHALKSSSANIGAIRLSALCRELEQLGRDGRTAGAKDLASRARHEYDRVTAALEDLLLRGLGRSKSGEQGPVRRKEVAT